MTSPLSLRRDIMYTPIQLDKIRNFRYGMKAFSLIEKTLELKSISHLDFDNMSMTETATIIWAGLVHEDANLTVDKVIDLVDEYSSIMEVAEVMAKAMNESLGAEKGKRK